MFRARVRVLARRRLRAIALAGVVVLAIGLVGFHGHSHSHGDLRVYTANGAVASLPEWRAGEDPAARSPIAVEPGALSFQLANAAGVDHSFLVLRADSAPASVALADENAVLPTGADVIGRVAPGVPGQDGQVVLGEGDYVLVCSSPGHASDGMVYRLTVR